ncbi:hypothetical protein BT93_L5199 [Corymbia citriodora subsp. variegata]|uniref:DUF4220 domain-containing protein n=1 Tax=Corymbia citriodora subsp. variegata TaxID=360336 RepID=A0A8T0CX52_CORYI|nr:hypothetical protein BT93_L5199 [Corymbia citriodora subsp. variegata]KAF7850625.1 hypothetical protein BT93_L5199 [Corymbia citriodora subsp. variegata]
MNEAAMSLSTVLQPLQGLWVVWGIQLLVIASFACEIILAILGSRRKYMTRISARFAIWAPYLLLSCSAAFALGKLSVVRIDRPDNPGYDVVLEGLLAPLLLMQLGYPDSITAYEWEDNRLGLRQMLNVGLTASLVLWILIRCWDRSSPISWLYLPLFMVGIGKSARWAWALHSVYDENSSVTAEDINEVTEIQRKFKEFPEDGKFDSAKDILKAYFRFECLKPHLVNWLYHPLFIFPDWMSIDDYPPNRAFTVTEIELNFMYDVLYTKAPVLYTRLGVISKFVGFLWLVSALWGFVIIFRHAFLIDMYVTYTYALLMAVPSLELYQIMVLPFSDWAVVKLSMNLKVPLVQRLLPFLADLCMRKKRWSRSIGQLNLFDHHLLHQKWPKLIGMVLDLFGTREIFWRYLFLSRKAIPLRLKELVVQKMVELDKKREQQPFKNRGEWTLETHDVQEKQGLSGSIDMAFDKSIIIWHIATEILHTLDRENSAACEGSKLLSDYMIYLLGVHPQVLSLTTADITLEHACCKLRPFYKKDQNSVSAHDILACADDREASLVGGDVTAPMDPCKATGITRRVIGDWDVLLEVQKLVADLRTMGDMWEIISSIWVEMLCYGAAKGHVYQHARLLRKGGELITHVWLLLAHKTDKYNSSMVKLPERPADASAPGKGCSSLIMRFFLGKRKDNIYDSRK